MVSKGNYPILWPNISGLVNYYNLPLYIIIYIKLYIYILETLCIGHLMPSLAYFRSISNEKGNPDGLVTLKITY